MNDETGLLAAAGEAPDGGDADGDADKEAGDAEPGFDLIEVAGDDAEHGAADADEPFEHVGEVLEVDELLAAHAMRAVSISGAKFQVQSLYL